MDVLLSAEGFALPFSDAIAAAVKPVEKVLWLVDQIDPLSRVKSLQKWDCVVLQGGIIISKLDQSAYSHRSRLEQIQAMCGSKHRAFDVAHFEFLDKHFANSEKQANPSKIVPAKIREEWQEWRSGEGAPEKGKLNRMRWRVASEGMAASVFPFSSFRPGSDASDRNMPFVAEFILARPWNETFDSGAINYWWHRFFGNQWIPWKKKDRRVKFRRLFEDLASELARYRS
jgi:hypothetical protein